MKTPLSLYVHIPWCVRKCPYCDFNSHELGGALPETEYVEALLGDLAADITTFDQYREVQSVFFGGGTPSLLSTSAILRFLDGARQLLAFAPNPEITLEANPGTVAEGADKFRGFRSAGVNRVSIGVQSFNADNLAALGRIHSANEARRAFESARAAGFDRINLDLMHGLPGQTLSGALEDLAVAISLAPEHISWYQLTIEPNTVFYKRPPPLPDEDTLWDIYEAGMALLESHGYLRYEISAFAREGEACRHNLNYWQFGDYLGVGAGAHGKLTREREILRTAKTRMPRDYVDSPRRKAMPIEVSALPVEFLMNALRLNAGFTLSLFEERTGLPAAILMPFLRRASSRQLIHMDTSEVRPTPLGLQYLNDLLVMAMEDFE